MNNILKNVVVAWLIRRAMELGGIFAIIVGVVQALPPSSQAALWRVLQGDWQNVPLGAIVGIIVAVWGYAWSFRSTTRSQIVTDNKQVPISELPQAKQTVVEEIGRTAVAKKKVKPLFPSK